VLIARIDDTALRETLLSAQSAERSARLALDLAQRNADRATTLEQAGAIAERDLESAQSALAAAQAAYADAQARLTAAQQQVDRTFIRAPFDGIVSERPVNAGDVVQPGTAVVTVVDPRSMRLEASVPAEQLASVHVGAPVRFSVAGYPGRTFTGRVDRINPAADPATRQVRIYVSIPNEDSRLVAGLFAQGRVTTETRTALLAPLSAVDQRGVTPMVMRIRGGKVERVPVQLGLRDDAAGDYEIVSGLSAGDTLLVGAAQGITPGTPVRVLPSTEPTAAERE
jgi:membrane fusion protein (multidrug efflux system)